MAVPMRITGFLDVTPCNLVSLLLMLVMSQYNLLCEINIT
jgi:hypothetical protein